MRRVFNILACILIAIALAGCATKRPAAPRSPDVRAALSERYPAADEIPGGDLQFRRETPVQHADLPALAKALPDVRFYTTELHTGYFEYPHVRVAVAVPNQGPISVYLSPTYSKSDPAFIQMLCQARASGAAEERAVADEIALLFATITHEGKIKDAHLDNGRFSADLWDSFRLFRRVSIVFADGRVASVALMNPKERVADD